MHKSPWCKYKTARLSVFSTVFVILYIHSKKFGKYTELYMMMMKILRDGAFLLGKNVCNLYSSLVNHLQNCTVNPLTLMRILVF